MMELVMKHHPSPKRWICLLTWQQLETSYSSLNHAQETRPWMCFTLSRWKICFRINEWRHQSRQPTSREIVHFTMDWVHLSRNQQYKKHHHQQKAQWVIQYKRVSSLGENDQAIQQSCTMQEMRLWKKETTRQVSFGLEKCFFHEII